MILVTGSTGNVGLGVINYLNDQKVPFRAAIIDAPGEKEKLPKNVESVLFYFDDESTHKQALEGVKAIFLMRPPMIVDIKKKMLPFLKSAKAAGVEYIVFLSLMGINPMVPHFKVERYVKKLKFDYTFLRCSFFMQNLSTTHAEVIREKQDLLIPVGSAKTSFIDARDIGKAAGILLETRKLDYRNKTPTLTGQEALDYYEVAKIMTKVLGKEFVYSNPSSKKFGEIMLEYGFNKEYVKVMKMLYRITKFGRAKKVTNELALILGHKPTSFEQFIEDYKETWI